MPATAAPRPELSARPAPKPLKLLRGLPGATEVLGAVPSRVCRSRVRFSSAPGAVGAGKHREGPRWKRSFGAVFNVLCFVFIFRFQAAERRKGSPQPLSRADRNGTPEAAGARQSSGALRSG